jgi:hypothetical protein
MSCLSTSEEYITLGTPPVRKGTMTRDALDLMCSTLPEVASELGVSIDSLRSYRTRRRSPGPETARALAMLMRKRARALNALAERLLLTLEE